MTTAEVQGIDDDEKDSNIDEDLNQTQLTELLLPHAWTDYARFALAVSKQSFKGWVKQPSPSCAAASLGILALFSAEIEYMFSGCAQHLARIQPIRPKGV
jgi:hypothetical protein